MANTTNTTSPASPAQPAIPRTKEEVKSLLARAQEGDETTLPAVWKLLEDPFYQQKLGNLAEHSAMLLIKALAGKDVLTREAVLKRLELMRTELLGENPTPVERLLVERIAACWLQVQHAEVCYAAGLKELTIPQSDFQQRRMDAANRRFLAAVKALALVRKLAIPVLQVNIAKKQVNVATPNAVAPAAV